MTTHSYSMRDMLMIPGLRELRQEDHGIEASLSCKVRPRLNSPNYPLSKQHRAPSSIDTVLCIGVYLLSTLTSA